MRLRCKAGDLAWVIHDEKICGTNIGRIVRVKGPALKCAYYGGKLTWLIFPVDSRPWAIAVGGGETDLRRIRYYDAIEHPDAWLSPLLDFGAETDFTEGRVGRPGSARACNPETQPRAVLRKRVGWAGSFSCTR